MLLFRLHHQIPSSGFFSFMKSSSAFIQWIFSSSFFFRQTFVLFPSQLLTKLKFWLICCLPFWSLLFALSVPRTSSSSDQLFTYDSTLSLFFPLFSDFAFVLRFCFGVFSLFVYIQWMHRRNYLLKKRLSKGPNKIVLSAADFVFPIDVRRVSCH